LKNLIVFNDFLKFLYQIFLIREFSIRIAYNT